MSGSASSFHYNKTINFSPSHFQKDLYALWHTHVSDFWAPGPSALALFPFFQQNDIPRPKWFFFNLALLFDSASFPLSDYKLILYYKITISFSVLTDDFYMNTLSVIPQKSPTTHKFSLSQYYLLTASANNDKMELNTGSFSDQSQLTLNRGPI